MQMLCPISGGDFGSFIHLSELANAGWQYFKQVLGLSIFSNSIQGFLALWFQGAHFRNQAGFAKTIIASCFCWEVWRARNSVMFDDTSMLGLGSVVIKTTIKWLHELHAFYIPSGPSCFSEQLSLECLSLLPKRSSIPRHLWIKWHPPDLGAFKQHVDGSSRNGQCSGGGILIIRDHHGSVIFSFSSFYG